MTYTPSPANGTKSIGNTSTTNIGSTTLSGGITGGASTIVVPATTGFPSTGIIKIDSEYILYTSKNSTDFLGCTRGYMSSTATSHSIASIVGGTFVGTVEFNNIPDVMISCQADQAGTLYADFSNDNVVWNPYPVLGFQTIANIHEFHNAVKGPRYYRTLFINTSGITTTT